MSEGKRPGGLTALAVINLIFAGLGLLSILSLGAAVAVFSLTEGSPELDKATQEIKIGLEEAGIGLNFLVFITALSVIPTVLLLVSGIGYIKQKKFLGRTLGNAYAVLGLAYSILSAAILPTVIGGGFNLMFIVNIIYPLLTLILLNTTFKDDFVN